MMILSKNFRFCGKLRNGQIKIILLNNRRPLFRRAYRGGDEKIILILMKQGSRKMRVVPEIFWEEETPQSRR